MFAPFILGPMTETHLKKVIKQRMIEQFNAEAGKDDPMKA